MERVQTFNPFVQHDSHGRGSLITYRILALLTLLLTVSVSTTLTIKAPPNGTTIWAQNEAYPTPFSLNPQIVSVYWHAFPIHTYTRSQWILLFALQFGYIYILLVFNNEHVNRAANVGSHFILHNLLQVAFLFLWVYGHFWYGEALLVLNYMNLKTLYFRHLKTPPYVHIPVVTGPMAWTFVAILSNGAAMVNAQSNAAGICANVAIWSILLYGLFFLLAFKDYAIGFELSALSLALAVHQLKIHVVALQWVFAFIIMGLLLLVTLVFATPPMFGKELVFLNAEDDVDDEDREREPLLG